MLNPFDTHQDGIVCISSGTVAAEETMRDLLAALEKEKKRCQSVYEPKTVIPIS